MAVSKIIYNDKTLIDLTSDTVTADTLAKGYTAHNQAGELITGTMESSGGISLPPSYTEDAVLYYTAGSSYDTLYSYSSYNWSMDDVYYYSDNNGQIRGSAYPNSGYYYFSTATTSHIGDNINNHLTAQNYLSFCSEHLTSKTATKFNVIWNYHSVEYASNVYTQTHYLASRYSDKPAVIDCNGKILFVGTWGDVIDALNNRTIDTSNGVGFVGSYYTKSQVSYPRYNKYDSNGNPAYYDTWGRTTLLFK